MVFTWHSGLYTGGVEQAAQLLLLALSQAVNDATRLLLLLQAHMDVCGQRVDAYCMCLFVKKKNGITVYSVE